MKKITKIRITPFLIVNPLVMVWATFILTRLLNRGGMAVIMSGLFMTIIFASGVLLIIDRLIVERINLWTIFIGEIFLILISIKLVDWYAYG